MISLILYGVLAAGAIFGAITVWHSVEHSISAPFVAEQIAHDQEVVNAANKRADDAEGRTKNAQSDTAACVSAVKTQSDLVDLWQGRAKENFAAAAKARAEGAAAHVVAQTAVQRYQQIAAAPPVKDQTCQQKLDATDKLLRDAARARAAAKAGK
jgi:flagellar basal body-associated protein FliL